MSNNVDDLRSALEFLRGIPGQLVETDVEVDPEAELCGVYRHVGAGGTVPRPTQEGPAMVFNNIKGHPDARVAIGLLASRDRVAKLLDADPKRLGFMLNPFPHVHPPYHDGLTGHALLVLSQPEALEEDVYQAFAQYLHTVVMA